MASSGSAIDAQWLCHPDEILQSIEDSQQQWIIQQATYQDVARVLRENCRRRVLEFHGQTPADGNCFFHAVSDQLDLLRLPSQSPAELRQSVVAFMRNNSTLQGPDGMINFANIYPDWNSFCDKMAKDGEWANHAVLVATAHLLRRDIMVVTSSPQSQGDQAVCWIRSGPSYKGKPIMLGHLYEWHYQSLQPANKDSAIQLDANYVRLQSAMQYICKRALPCISDVLHKWHNDQTKKLGPCQTPLQCTTKGKPKPGKSCPTCVDWGKTVEAAYYNPTAQANLSILWNNVNPTLLHQDPIEAAKAFVLRLVVGKTYSKVGDFDVAGVLMLMMNFTEFHGGSQSVHDKIKEYESFPVSQDDVVESLRDKLAQGFADVREEISGLTQKIPTMLQSGEYTHNMQHVGQPDGSSMSAQAPLSVSSQDQSQTGGRESPEEAFDLPVFQRELRNFYRRKHCKIPQFPGDKRNYLNMDDIYTNVSVLLILPKPCTPLPIPLDTHHEIFTRETDNGITPTRILVLGNPGCGKSVLTLKLAYDWATENHDSPLKTKDLVFALNMRWMTPQTTLEEAIFQQLLPKNTKLSQTVLRDYIERNQSSCIILLDSFDEYGFRGNFTEQESGIHSILSNERLRECQVLVASRLWKAGDFNDLQDVYTQMEVTGFTDENVKDYVLKFFSNDKAAGERLLSYMADHHLISGIANVPLMTLLFCLYWKESGGQDLPNKIGDLFGKIFKFLERQYIAKKMNESVEITLSRLIIETGKVALSGLWSSKDSLVFSVHDFADQTSEEIVTAGCKIGLLSIETRTQGPSVADMDDDADDNVSPSGFDQNQCVTFFHKTCQEKCAGEYLAHLYSSDQTDFRSKTQSLASVQMCMQLEMVLRFACGASSEVAHHILQRLVIVFNREFPPAKVQQYYQERLDADDAKRLQKFIELCLQCYYECPGDTEAHLLLNDLFPEGQILLTCMAPYTSNALGEFLLRSAPTVKSVRIRGSPSPGDKWLFPMGLIHRVWTSIQDSLKDLPKAKLQSSYQSCPKRPNLNNFQNLCKTEVANYFKDWHSSNGINLERVFTSLRNCKNLDTIELINVRLAQQMMTLQSVIEEGSLYTLTTLMLFNCGLTSEQMDKLLVSISLGKMPELSLFELSCNGESQAQFTHLGDCLVHSKIKDLFAYKMKAQATDMKDVITKMPRYGPRMESLYMDGSEIDDDTGKALATNLHCANKLIRFGVTVDLMKKNTHNEVIRALGHLTHLTELLIYHSRYLDDLLQCLAESMDSLQDLKSVTLSSAQVEEQQSSQSTLARLKGKILPDHVKRSACQQFTSKLKTMMKMKKLDFKNIRLHKEDLVTLLDFCKQNNYKFIRYSKHLFPEEVSPSQYECLIFS